MGFPVQCVCKASRVESPSLPSATHFPIHLPDPVSPQAATRAQFTNPSLSCTKGEEDLMVWINRNLHLLYFKYFLFLPWFAALSYTMHIKKFLFSTWINMQQGIAHSFTLLLESTARKVTKNLPICHNFSHYVIFKTNFNGFFFKYFPLTAIHILQLVKRQEEGTDRKRVQTGWQSTRKQPAANIDMQQKIENVRIRMFMQT